MDGISVAASVLAIATAGVQISIKLVSFSNQVATASDRIKMIGSDVSITSNVLQQLSELMTKRDGDQAIAIFNDEGLQNAQASAASCKAIFIQLEDVLKRSSKQLRSGMNSATLGAGVNLSKLESVKWPFLQPEIADLRLSLKDARETLMLLLHVTTLAYWRKLAEMSLPTIMTADDRALLVSDIFALHQAKVASARDLAKSTAIPERQDKAINGGSVVAPIVVASTSNSIASKREQDTSCSPPTQTTAAEFVTLEDTVDCKATSITSKKSQHSHHLEKARGFARFPHKKASHKSYASLDNASERRVRSIDPQSEEQPKDLPAPKSIVLSAFSSKSVNNQSCQGYMEVWVVSPVILPEKGTYVVHWASHTLPLNQEEIEHRWQKSRCRKRMDLVQKYEKLLPKEREAIELLFDSLPHAKPTILGMDFTKLASSLEPVKVIPWRSILLILGSTVVGGHGDGKFALDTNLDDMRGFSISSIERAPRDAWAWDAPDSWANQRPRARSPLGLDPRHRPYHRPHHQSSHEVDPRLQIKDPRWVAHLQQQQQQHQHQQHQHHQPQMGWHQPQGYNDDIIRVEEHLPSRVHDHRVEESPVQYHQRSGYRSPIQRTGRRDDHEDEPEEKSDQPEPVVQEQEDPEVIVEQLLAKYTTLQI